MTLSAELLASLEARWGQRDLRVREHLEPGLSDAALNAAESLIGVPLNDELRTWLGWQGGQSDNAKAHPGPWFLGPQSMADQRQMMLELDETEADIGAHEPGAIWRPDWVPITRNAAGGVLACSTSDDRSASCDVRYVDTWVAPMPPDPFAFSLGDVVSWWVELYDRGTYFYDPDLQLWRLDDSDASLARSPAPQHVRMNYAW